MTDPKLIPCLITLRFEFNQLNPDRDRGADGWIGDAAHQAEKSDHNPDALGRVLAIDVDSTGPWPARQGINDSVVTVVERHRTGDDARLQYVIWNRQYASISTGWEWRPYTGADPHTSHAHFSGRHDHVGGTDTSPWGVFMSLTPADIDAVADAVVDKLLAKDLGKAGGDDTVAICLQSGYGNTRTIKSALGVIAEDVAQIRAAVTPTR